jgi:hypothetical protein
MATSLDYESRIAGLSWGGLLDLWERIGSQDTPGWEPGKAFEYLILRAFQLDGADVRWPYRVRILDEVVEQVDGVIYCNGLKCLVESKSSRKDVDFGPIAKLRAQLQRRPAETLGILFSQGGFTGPARVLAQFVAPQSVLLWSGDEIQYGLRQKPVCEGLMQKYRIRVEEGIPDYDIRERRV